MSYTGSGSPTNVGSSGGSVDANQLVAALIQQLQGTSSPSSGIGGYVKSKPPTFSGKKKDWPLFKMQLVAYLAGLGLEGVLEEAFDTMLPAT